MFRQEVSLETVNARHKNSMVDHLGIEVIEIGDDYMIAKMPVDNRTKQPLGLLHGGASVALAETLGSVAANCVIDLEKHFCVCPILPAFSNLVCLPQSICNHCVQKVWQTDISNTLGQLAF